MLFRYSVRYVDFIFYPVSIFFVSQLLHVLGIIRIVVDCRHGAELVKSFYQHTFCIEVGKSQWALDVCHAFGFAPFFYGFQQCRRYFYVIDEIYPAETYIFFIPFLIGFMVDNGCYTAYQFIIFISQKVFGLTKFKRSVFLFVERIKHIVIKIGNRIRVTLIHLEIETNKLF